MGSQHFCLRWSNYQSNLLTVFDDLLSSKTFVDVTLACEGSSIQAHKMVLSACSTFFKELFCNNPCQHPIVILKDIRLNDLKAIIQFMYRGEVNVKQEQLAHLLDAAEALRVKGLAELTVNQRGGILNPLTSNAQVQHESVKLPTECRLLREKENDICSSASNGNAQGVRSPISKTSPSSEDDICNNAMVDVEELKSMPSVKKEIPDAKSVDVKGRFLYDRRVKDISKVTDCFQPAKSRKLDKKDVDRQCDDGFPDPSMLVEQMMSIQMQTPLLSEVGSIRDEDSNSFGKSAQFKDKRRQTEKYEACPVCHKEFANHNNYILKQHMAIHSPVPVRFTCDVCLKSFRWRNNLYVHRKKYHRGVSLSPTQALLVSHTQSKISVPPESIDPPANPKRTK